MLKKFMPTFLATSALFGVNNYQETLYPHWGQSLTVKEMIYEEKSDFWDLAIFDNDFFGRVLAMDGVIQETERDEPIYHEMMAHVPLLTHGNAKSVLIIGGGDGGLLREVLRHETLEKVVLVEIDKAVIELSKKYMPMICKGAFEDSRAHIVIQDAAQYVKESSEKFDVIICDSNDPEGPAKALFTSEFYGDCKNLLQTGGIFVNQNGVPFLQKNELTLTYNNRKLHFTHVGFYLAAVPTYVGGFMALGFASDEKYSVSQEELSKRMEKVKGKMLYYTPAIHAASFALPQYILEEVPDPL